MHVRPRANSNPGARRHCFPDGGDRDSDGHEHRDRYTHCDRRAYGNRHDANTDSHRDAHERLDADSVAHSNTNAHCDYEPGRTPDTRGSARRQGAGSAAPGYAHGRDARAHGRPRGRGGRHRRCPAA